MSSMPQCPAVFQPGVSRHTVARTTTCRWCDADCLVGLCFDGRWRIFNRAFHTGPATTGTRWWLTRGRGMVHDGVADSCPTRWVGQHFCRGSAEALGGLLTGIIPGIEGGGGAE